MGTLSPYPWQGHCPCTHYAVLSHSECKYHKTARSKEESLRDEIPQTGLGGSPTLPTEKAAINKKQTDMYASLFFRSLKFLLQ